MATTRKEFYTSDDHNHLETFTLIWFDSSGYIEKNQGAEQKLRTIINQFKRFEDQEECRRYIEQRPQTDQLVLIVSGRLNQQMVDSIHQLRQISSIYVYHKDKRNNDEWPLKFAKVRLR